MIGWSDVSNADEASEEMPACSGPGSGCGFLGTPLTLPWIVVIHADSKTPEDCGPGEPVEGVVTRLHARHAMVRAEGRTVRCSLRKSLFRDQVMLTQPLAVGDRVRATFWEGREGVVDDVLERTSCLSRSFQGTERQQILVANVDLVVITVALAEPDFRPRLIDRLLVAAEREDLDSLVVLNKADLVGDRTPFEERAHLLRELGHPVLFTSALTGEGIQELRRNLKDRTSVLAGQSGVGKSCLLNALQPGLALRTGAPTGKWKKGRHTTTAVALLPLEGGGYVVDTPGFRAFGITGLEHWEVGHLFRDIKKLAPHCRFPTCTHTHEPDCAVKEGLAGGSMHPDRYESYLRIIAGGEDIQIEFQSEDE